MAVEFYRPPVQKTPRETAMRRPLRLAASLALALALAAAAGAGTAALFRVHPRFAVVRVVLEGIPESHRADVERLTDAWIGQPLLYADLDGPMGQLQKRGWVVRASARRVVPDTIEVKVVSNAPVALVRCDEGLCTIDLEGNVLGPWAGRGVSKKDDFVLIDVAPETAAPEARVAALARGAALVQRLAQEDPSLLQRASEIEVLPAGFALVDRVARVRLILGPDAAVPGRTAPLWRVFLALLPELKRQAVDVEEADLRFADQIVLKKPADELRGKT